MVVCRTSYKLKFGSDCTVSTIIEKIKKFVSFKYKREDTEESFIKKVLMLNLLLLNFVKTRIISCLSLTVVPFTVGIKSVINVSLK